MRASPREAVYRCGEEVTVASAITVPHPARPDLAAFDAAHRSDFPTVVRELARLLGLKLTAYLAGARDTRTVRSWIDGSRGLRRADAEPRLRTALHVALLIAEHDSPQIAQAWFQGLNPQLDDRSPARLLREGELHDAGPLVVSAARAFVVGG